MASTYCSRNRDVTIASRNDLVPKFSVYQLGRGSDPVMVVGSMIPAVAFNIVEASPLRVAHARYSWTRQERTIEVRSTLDSTSGGSARVETSRIAALGIRHLRMVACA